MKQGYISYTGYIEPAEVSKERTAKRDAQYWSLMLRKTLGYDLAKALVTEIVQITQDWVNIAAALKAELEVWES